MINAPENKFKKRMGMFLIIVVLGFTAYSFMLKAPFKTTDDAYSIVLNQDIKNFNNIGKIFSRGFFGDHSYYRPLVSLSFMAEYHLFDLNPFFYNLTNVGLHLATSIIIFFLINFILKDETAGFFVSLLFAIHPIHWEAVSNIPGRSVVLCAFFYFSAFLAYCLFKTREQKAVYYALTLCFFTLALLCKESAIMFPVMILSYEWFIERKPRQGYVSTVLRIIPFAAVNVIYFFVRKSLGITELSSWGSFQTALLGLMTSLRAAVTYLRLFVLPVDLHFDRARMVFERFAQPELWMTLLFFFILIFGLIKLRKKFNRETRFFMAWFWIELFPAAHVIAPISVQPGCLSTAEHFLYTPSVGIFVLMVWVSRYFYCEGMKRKFFSKAVYAASAAGFLIFLFLTLIQQNIYSSSQIAMTQQSVDRYPENARMHNALGLALAEKFLFKEAEGHFRKSLQFDPQNVIAQISLGKSLCDQGRYLEGSLEYEKIADAGKHAPLLKNNMRLTYGRLIRQYKAAIEKDQANAALPYSLGVIYSKKGQLNEAVDAYLRAVQIDPSFKNAVFNLASSYEVLGEWQEAISHYEKWITLNQADKSSSPLDYYAYFHLGLVYEKLGDAAQSRRYFLESLKMRPGFNEAQKKLGGIAR